MRAIDYNFISSIATLCVSTMPANRPATTQRRLHGKHGELYFIASSNIRRDKTVDRRVDRSQGSIVDPEPIHGRLARPLAFAGFGISVPSLFIPRSVVPWDVRTSIIIKAIVFVLFYLLLLASIICLFQIFPSVASITKYRLQYLSLFPFPVNNYQDRDANHIFLR